MPGDPNFDPNQPYGDKDSAPHAARNRVIGTELGLDPNSPQYRLADLFSRTRTSTAGIFAQGAESMRIRDAEDKQNQDAKNRLTREVNWQNQQQTLSDRDVQLMFTQARDEAEQQRQGAFSSLRYQLGRSGVRGGAASDLASRIEMERMASVYGIRGNLALAKANADAQDRLSRFQRELGLFGAQTSTAPSTAYSDFLSSIIDFRDNQDVRREASAAARKASKDSLFGGVVGALGSVAAGALA